MAKTCIETYISNFTKEYKNEITGNVKNSKRCSIIKGVLKYFSKFTGKQLYQNFIFDTVEGLKSLQLYEKRTLAQVISCDL